MLMNICLLNVHTQKYLKILLPRAELNQGCCLACRYVDGAFSSTDCRVHYELFQCNWLAELNVVDGLKPQIRFFMTSNKLRKSNDFICIKLLLKLGL